MSTIVDRDWTQQEKFGKELTDFENNMSACSKSLRAHIEEARGSIQEDNASVALDFIIQLLDQIDSSLPSISEFGIRQIKLAHHIRDAEEVKFTRY